MIGRTVVDEFEGRYGGTVLVFDDRSEYRITPGRDYGEGDSVRFSTWGEIVAAAYEEDREFEADLIEKARRAAEKERRVAEAKATMSPAEFKKWYHKHYEPPTMAEMNAILKGVFMDPIRDELHKASALFGPIGDAGPFALAARTEVVAAALDTGRAFNRVAFPIEKSKARRS